MNFSAIGPIAIQIAYYTLVGLSSFFAAFGAYILIRYGESRTFSVVLALAFIFFYLTALSQSYSTLISII